MSFYPFLKTTFHKFVNKKNLKLRKLAKILAYENFENYMKIIEIFFCINQYGIEGNNVNRLLKYFVTVVHKLMNHINDVYHNILVLLYF